MLCSTVGIAQRDVASCFNLARTSEGYWLDFSLGEVQLLPLSEKQYVLHTEGLSDANTPTSAPRLPSASRLVVLPRGMELTVEDINCQWQLLSTLPGYAIIAPAPYAVPKDNLPLPAEPDEALYASQRAVSLGPAVQVQALGNLGPNTLYRITINPFAYHPTTGRIDCATHITATLPIKGFHTELLDPMQKLLIVAPETYRDGLQPFVRWKRQEGYLVRELYVSTTKRDSIRPLIRPILEQWQQGAMPYLLLVGDVAQLQAYLGKYKPYGFDGHVTDLYYAELTGDYLPDAYYGRWPVNDTAELRRIVEKTIRYEQFKDIDTTALKRMLFVAGSEASDPAPITTNGQVDYASRLFSTLDTLCYRNPTSEEQLPNILHDIDSGVALINYTAHCTTAGWTKPKLGFSTLDTLRNPHPLFYINNCCSSNNYGGNCFGEQLLRRPTGGAVAVIGGTNSTLWNEDYYWAVGPKYPFSLHPLYDADRQGALDCLALHPTAGELLMAGNMAVSAFGSPYDAFYWEIYCLLGDPTLRPHFGIPTQASLALVDSACAGNTSLRLVATPYATLTALQGDSLIGTTTALSDGSALILLCQSLDTLPLLLTASGPGLVPATLTTAPHHAHRSMGVLDIDISDTTIDFTIANLGTDTLRHISSHLWPSDTISPNCILSEDISLDSLLPTQRVRVSLAYHLQDITPNPTWHSNLYVDEDSLHLHFRLSHRMTIAVPEITLRITPQNANSCLLTALSDTPADSLKINIKSIPSLTQVSTIALSSPIAEIDATVEEGCTHLFAEAMGWWQGYPSRQAGYFVMGHRYDSFEAGMQSYPWQLGGTTPWQIDSLQHRSGRYALRSGAIDYRQTSDLLLHVYLPEADSLSYWARTSSEQGCDQLVFSIDGQQRGNALGGETEWRRFAVLVPAGSHTLRWRYAKDELGTVGEDCAWIDDVRLPTALWDEPYGWFGDYESLNIQPATEVAIPFRIGPNPTDGWLRINGAEADEVRLLDCYGRTIAATVGAVQLPYVLNLEGLPAGIYMLLISHRGYTYHYKIIHQPRR